jgi:hypothetical protein
MPTDSLIPTPAPALEANACFDAAQRLLRAADNDGSSEERKHILQCVQYSAERLPDEQQIRAVVRLVAVLEEVELELRIAQLRNLAPFLARIEFTMEGNLGDEGEAFSTLEEYTFKDTQGNAYTCRVTDLEYTAERPPGGFAEEEEDEEEELLTKLRAITGNALADETAFNAFAQQLNALCFTQYEFGPEWIELRPIATQGESETTLTSTTPHTEH